ncbi:hypothetical protein BEH94_08925 [Candidatus Altiarchaeales archaeon WOR_SM1_SCG]|nr:hypothetical protein BEH94_08925 [Candidatus Altiarchaeales archaeon WOR_SM1_SCG]
MIRKKLNKNSNTSERKNNLTKITAGILMVVSMIDNLFKEYILKVKGYDGESMTNVTKIG